ncbi:hypothetical protein [Parafilimonas terrae]|uniref:Uncharacterized protein n=1 Tax=Parafilimonas terrae TaxID=1465490 RepID=A0A1I5Y7F3_9BACT|nr:hypothetical protein [Parafilimonas terrae]SFQ40093.1 hypothetical protein SAMN05444277_1111 [Parafilimonas terrae]
MAKLKGIIKIEGTLDELTFYKTQDGHLVKTKSGVSGDRIANDPTFQRTRENGSEFGAAASAGKLLRDTVRTLMLSASDNRITARVTQLMTIIKNYDTTSARGERTVGVGIAAAGATDELKNFDFNINAIISSIFYKPYSVDTATGVISITGLVPINDIAAPTGATHVTLRGAWAKVDFAGGTSSVEYTNAVNLPIDGTSGNVTLTPAAVPAGTGTSVFLFAVEFFQEVNGVQYTLKNGAYNALSIVEVA